ncbi:MAG: ATP-binding protein [Acidobacteria bacterium]|nr:ATP-binding protein [Acidobacteriota bacterium]
MSSILTDRSVLLLAALTIIGLFAFAGGWMLIRRMRRTLTQEPTEAAPRRNAEPGPEFAAAAVQAVIARLKEQEIELERLRKAEYSRAQTSENISAAVLSNLSSGVLLFGPALLVRQANEAARSILGYASPTGLHAREVFQGAGNLRLDPSAPGPTPASLADAVELCLRSGASLRRLEADYTTPSGEKRVLGITLSPVRGAAGEALGAACLVSDLTEISSMTQQMRLRENLASLGEMSAGIAHEFKNSLATISGYAQMLTAENDPQSTQQFAGKIVSETASLTRIVTDFLNFARPKGLEAEIVELRSLIEDCARECGVTLKLDGFAGDLALLGEATALRQAFSNLLRNSAEAGRDGAPVTVVVRAEADGQATRLVFKDDGSGIPGENLARIFVPFFTTKAAGTGLGLALVHRIVSDHGGTVSVASDTSGSTFTLSFPARKPSGPEPEQR